MIHIRQMTVADIPLGMRLREQAGWNQTEADWRRFLHLEPEGCFVAELDGVPAATVVAFVFGPVAWVAMVLVEQSLRRRGLGTALMTHALEFLDRRGVRSVRLDATPLGQPLYEKLGFVVEHELGRFEGVLPGAAPVPGVTNLSPGEAVQVFSLDQRVTGADREKLLTALWNGFFRHPGWRVVRQNGRLAGFLTARPGAKAWQIGPGIASAEAGPLLLADAWQRHSGRRVYIDIPLANAPAVASAEAQGLTCRRRLVRMCRGPSVGERVAELWASSGPEKG